MPWLKTRALVHSIAVGQRRLMAFALRRGPWATVWTLAVAQDVSWGSLYCAFSLFVVPLQETFGWSRPLLNGALLLGLFTGAVAFPVGARIIAMVVDLA